MSKPLFVNDGDTLVLIAKTSITVSDPTDDYPYVAQTYRVVADRVGPVLALVPLSQFPVKVTQDEVAQYKTRAVREEAREELFKASQVILKLVNDPQFVEVVTSNGFEIVGGSVENILNALKEVERAL